MRTVVKIKKKGKSSNFERLNVALGLSCCNADFGYFSYSPAGPGS